MQENLEKLFFAGKIKAGIVYDLMPSDCRGDGYDIALISRYDESGEYEIAGHTLAVKCEVKVGSPKWSEGTPALYSLIMDRVVNLPKKIDNPRTKTDKRVNWLIDNYDAIYSLPRANHSRCRGNCNNGATCRDQSIGGWGYWVWALRRANIDHQSKNYWSGSNPTPSTSIRRVIAKYILDNCPAELR